ncbi:MAG: S41 family peptidase [Pseudomonadales bacterium]
MSALCTTSNADTSQDNAAIDEAGQLPLEDLRTFSLVLEQIRAAYVEPVSDKTLLENAIRGMLGELDPHSTYLDETDFNDLKNMTSGEFGGLGIEVGAADGFIKIIAPLDDTPASRAGIHAGDIIIKIDAKSVQGMAIHDAIDLMRGKVGTPIALTIMREKQEQPLEFNLVREIIKTRSVKEKFLAPGYAYIRIAQFQASTTEELKRALTTLEKQENIRGLVLDLRNNPGGLLDEAVGVSDVFLNKGLIVYTKGRIPSSNTRFNASAGEMLSKVPMIVLVNQGTASAAEIVAGALQDNHRAKILGTNTFGKGTVQTVVPISEKKGIKLTTALYYTPNGRSIQAEGIKPDIADRDNTLSVAQSNALTSEASLDKHIANNNGNAAKKVAPNKRDNNAKEETSGASTSTNTSSAIEDNQLQDALKLLQKK